MFFPSPPQPSPAGLIFQLRRLCNSCNGGVNECYLMANSLYDTWLKGIIRADERPWEWGCHQGCHKRPDTGWTDWLWGLFYLPCLTIYRNVHWAHRKPNSRLCEWLPELLFNYSETRHQKRTRHSQKSYVFLFLRFWHFWWENDVTNLAPEHSIG